MSNPLAPTVFSSGAKDTLATLDVYRATGDSVVNSIQALAKRNNTDISTLLGGKLSGATLNKLFSQVGQQLTVDKDALTARLVGASSTLKSAYRELSTSLKDGVVGSFEDLGTMKITLGGIEQTVASQNFSDLTSVGSFLNAYTGNKDLFKAEDVDAMAGVISAMVAEGSELGMDNVFSSLTNNLTDPGLMTRVVKQTVPRVIAAGDFKTLYDMSASSAGPAIGVLYPEFAQLLTGSYQRQQRGAMQNPQQDYDRIIGSLLNVNAQWDKIVRQNGEDTDFGINLLALLGSSRDFQSLVVAGVMAISDNNDPKKYHILGGAYQKTTVMNELKRFFPMVYLATDRDKQTTAQRKTVDPRTLNALSSVATSILS